MVYTQGKLKYNDQSTGVIYGVINALRMYVERFNPQQVYIVGEGKHSRDRRRKIYSGYKEGRKSNLPIPKEQFYEQVDYLKDIFYNLGVNYIDVDYFEADDIIAVLSRIFKDKQKVIISSDGDYLQLVSDNLRIFNPSKEEVIGLENFKEIVGVDSFDFLTYKCMVGDTSDKIKGIQGCGEKTALEILGWMGYELFAECKLADIPVKLQKAFTPEAKLEFELAKKLIDLSEVPITHDEVLDKMVWGMYNSEEAQELLIDVDCWSILDHWKEIEMYFGVLNNEI